MSDNEKDMIQDEIQEETTENSESSQENIESEADYINELEEKTE